MSADPLPLPPAPVPGGAGTAGIASRGGLQVIAAAIGLVTLVGIALSVSNPLLALEMDRWGVPSTIAGLSGAMAGLGTILAVPFVPALAARWGVRTLLAGSLAITAGAFVGFWLWPNLPIWFILRFCLGASIGAVFLLSEFWINAAASPERRGRVMGAYATALYAGFAFGPLLLTYTGTMGALPYFCAAAIAFFGLIPLLGAGLVTPSLHGKPSGSLLGFIRNAPTATMAALAFGALETGLIMQLPVHGLRLGLSEADATLLLTSLTLGNVLFQLPLGLISDYTDRRRLLFLLALVSAVLAALLVAAGSDFWLNWGLLFLVGGVSGGLYSVGLAHLGSRFTGMDLASANAVYVLLYSIGLLLGPPMIGFGIDLFGILGLPLISAAFLFAYAALAGWRLLRARPMPPA